MSLIIEIAFGITILLILIIYYLLNNIYKDTKEIPNKTNLSGFEIARKLTSKIASEEPHIIKKRGKFLDHYNSERNVLKLSPEVFDGTNIYAAVVASYLALETNPQKLKLSKARKMSSFLVLSSYTLIIIGAFLNNISIIDFGFILFIIAFFIHILAFNILIKPEEELKKYYDILKEENVITNLSDYKEIIIGLYLTRIATLPYNFLIYFR